MNKFPREDKEAAHVSGRRVSRVTRRKLCGQQATQATARTNHLVYIALSQIDQDGGLVKILKLDEIRNAFF